jgi:hypothetical protein
MNKCERIAELEKIILSDSEASNEIYDEYVALLEVAYKIEEYMYHESK